MNDYQLAEHFTECHRSYREPVDRVASVADYRRSVHEADHRDDGGDPRTWTHGHSHLEDGSVVEDH